MILRCFAALLAICWMKVIYMWMDSQNMNILNILHLKIIFHVSSSTRSLWWGDFNFGQFPFYSDNLWCLIPVVEKKTKKEKPKKGLVTTLSLPRLRNAVTWQEQNLPEEAAPSVNYDGGKKAVCFNHVISAPSIKMLQQKMLHLQTCQTRIMFLLIIKYFTRSVIEKGKRKHSKCGSEFWTWILDLRKLHKDIYTFYLLDDSKC